MAKLLAKPSAHGVSEDLVWLALDRLDRAKLLELSLDEMGTTSRRKALTKLARTGVVLPMVWSIIAPDALSAASSNCVSSCLGVADGTCCTGAAACQTCGGGMCMGAERPAKCSMCGTCP